LQIYTTSDDALVRVWNAGSGALSDEIALEAAPGWSVEVRDDGARLLVVSGRGTGTVYDVPAYTPLFTFPARFAHFSPDGKHIAATQMGANTLTVYDGESGETRFVLDAHNEPVFKFRFDDAGTRLLSASFDGTARVWGLTDGAELAVCKSVDRLMDAFFVNGGRYLLTCDHNNRFALWDPEMTQVEPGVGQRATLIHDMESYGVRLRVADLSPNGYELVSTSAERWFQQWDLFRPSGADTLHYTNRSGSGPSALDVEGDIAVLSSANEQGTAIFALGTRELRTMIRVLEVDRGTYLHARDAAMKSLVTVPGGFSAAVWDMEPIQLRTLLVGHDGFIHALDMSDDGAVVLTGSADGTARMWDAQTGEEQAVLREHEGPVNDVVLGAGHAVAFTCGDDGRVLAWNGATGEFDREIAAFETPLTALALDANGTRLLCGDKNGTVRAVNPISGEVETALSDDSGRSIKDIGYTAGGSVIAVTSIYEGLYLWDADTMESLLRMTPNHGLAEIPDNMEQVVLATARGQLRVAPIAPWESEKRTGVSDEAWKQRVEQHRRERLEATDSFAISDKPNTYVYVTNNDTLRDRLRDLAAAARSSAASNERLCGGRTDLQAVGESLHIPAGLCLASVNGRAVANAESTAQAVEDVLARYPADARLAVQLELDDGERRITVVYSGEQLRQTKRPVNLSVDDAIDVLSKIATDHSATRGRDAKAVESGLSVTGTAEEYVRNKGLIQFDLIRSVDNVPVSDSSAFRRTLESLLAGLRDGSTREFNLQVERGLFRRIEFQYRV